MLEISFLSAELAFTAVWLLVRIIIWIRRNSIDWKREAVLLLMYLNLAVIIRFREIWLTATCSRLFLRQQQFSLCV